MLRLMLFSGNANQALAQSVAAHLEIPLANAIVGAFSDGETRVEIMENVRGRDVFVLQSTCPPTNQTLMELLILVDALKRSSAARITAVIPYFGYARQDRRLRSSRVPITAKVVASLIGTSGVDRVLTVDLHADQIQGFFDIPLDNVYATSIMLQDILQQQYSNVMIVSPDVGGVVRARAMAKRLDDADLAIIDKRRTGPNKAQVMHVIGDVAGRNCIIVDDIVDTAGTLCGAAKKLKEDGALTVTAYITHAVLSGPAIENIQNSDLDAVVVTDTIALSPEAKNCDRIRQLSLAPMLAQAIRRVHEEESVSSMFE